MSESNVAAVGIVKKKKRPKVYHIVRKRNRVTIDQEFWGLFEKKEHK